MLRRMANCPSMHCIAQRSEVAAPLLLAGLVAVEKLALVAAISTHYWVLPCFVLLGRCNGPAVWVALVVVDVLIVVAVRAVRAVMIAVAVTAGATLAVM